jgi:hypothetical protein
MPGLARTAAGAGLPTRVPFALSFSAKRTAPVSGVVEFVADGLIGQPVEVDTGAASGIMTRAYRLMSRNEEM